MEEDLPDFLAQRLRRELPGRRAQSRFEPELSFGRHYAPPPDDARRAAVLLLLYPHEGAWHVPLTLRPDTMVDHAGQVSLPGGLIEPGEQSHEAALRELEEELGVGREGVRLLGELSPLYVFVSNFVVTPWVAATRERPALHANPREVAEVLEVPLAYLLDPSNLGRHQREFHGLKFSAPHLPWGTHRIWGATGMMLGELIAILAEGAALEHFTPAP